MGAAEMAGIGVIAIFSLMALAGVAYYEIIYWAKRGYFFLIPEEGKLYVVIKGGTPVKAIYRRKGFRYDFSTDTWKEGEEREKAFWLLEMLGVEWIGPYPTYRILEYQNKWPQRVPKGQKPQNPKTTVVEEHDDFDIHERDEPSNHIRIRYLYPVSFKGLETKKRARVNLVLFFYITSSHPITALTTITPYGDWLSHAIGELSAMVRSRVASSSLEYVQGSASDPNKVGDIFADLKDKLNDKIKQYAQCETVEYTEYDIEPGVLEEAAEEKTIATLKGQAELEAAEFRLQVAEKNADAAAVMIERPGLAKAVAAQRLVDAVCYQPNGANAVLASGMAEWRPGTIATGKGGLMLLPSDSGQIPKPPREDIMEVEKEGNRRKEKSKKAPEKEEKGKGGPTKKEEEKPDNKAHDTHGKDTAHTGGH